MSYINGVLRIIEELIRIVNKLVESDEFLRLTFYLIWTKDVKFAKKKNLERSSSYADGPWANGMKNWSITGL